MKESIFDERFELNDSAKNNIIYNEHLIRYEFAKEFVKERTVLEIACGTGYGSNMLVEAGAKNVIAMDIDENAIRKASEEYKKENLQFKIGDAESIDLADNSVDVLVSFETIEHLKNPEKFLSEAKRVLKPNGIIIVSTPNFFVSKNKNPYHIFEYTEAQFKAVLYKQFAFVKILNQSNAISSVINLDSKRNLIYQSSVPTASFFVAICSDNETVLPEKNFVGMNALALENLYNNPGFKLVNRVYGVVVRIPGVKKILKIFS